MEIALQQNEIMNAFFDDWKALAEDESSSGGKPDVYLKAYQSFTDLRYLKDRTISCICWHPTIYGNAVKILIWDLNDMYYMTAIKYAPFIKLSAFKFKNKSKLI